MQVRNLVARLVAGRILTRAKGPIRRIIGFTGFELVPFSSTDTSRLVGHMRNLKIRTVLDVGANQGQYGSALRLHRWGGHIVSFEPSSDAYRLLLRRARNDPAWETRQMALGSGSTIGQLNISRNSVSSSFLRIEEPHLAAAPESKVTAQERVQISELDTFADGLPGPLWLKIDTQGYEQEVLDGATSTLSRVTAIQMELSMGRLYSGQPDHLSMLLHLRKNGLEVIDIINGLRDPKTGFLLQCDVIASRR